jgi:hypothetical protein
MRRHERQKDGGRVALPHPFEQSSRVGRKMGRERHGWPDGAGGVVQHVEWRRGRERWSCGWQRVDGRTWTNRAAVAHENTDEPTYLILRGSK